MQSNLDRMRVVVFNQINTLKGQHAGLLDSTHEVAIGHGVLRNEIDSISGKIYLTIFAESKGRVCYYVSCAYLRYGSVIS